MEFATGQQLLATPDLKRYVLVNNFSEENHLVTKEMLQNAFKDKYDKIMSNREPAWFVYEYYD